MSPTATKRSPEAQAIVTTSAAYRRSVARLEETTAKRDAAIVAAWRAGLTYPEMAALADVSRTRVAQVLAPHRAGRTTLND